jgi:hypothetical protein
MSSAFLWAIADLVHLWLVAGVRCRAPLIRAHTAAHAADAVITPPDSRADGWSSVRCRGEMTRPVHRVINGTTLLGIQSTERAATSTGR